MAFGTSVLILLLNRTHAVEREEQITHMTDDLRLGKRAYRAAVVGISAVIAHHEIFVIAQRDRAVVAIGGMRDEAFGQCLAV